ncbi:hypothetical protein BgiBS90_008093, partial [Biomphalaria glabrata]
MEIVFRCLPFNVDLRVFNADAKPTKRAHAYMCVCARACEFCRRGHILITASNGDHDSTIDALSHGAVITCADAATSREITTNDLAKVTTRLRLKCKGLRIMNLEE